ncbi:MAG: sigma-54-dependent Fis family transcriptional regulator [Deltaproteobacteria bacterium HGW-Deltaproteobacteria-1]|nr:MAG: sigma-54-dependent Fis family transcriptional regulator [Deltaproteobacteria bacterium HGW-Deltaproteobacteria-1]
MKWALTADYDVYLAEDRPSAIALINKEQPAVITLDLGLPPNPAGVEEGFAVLDHVLDEYGNTKVIIITGRGEKEHALRAVGKGAYDFFYKPIELDELKVVLKRAFHVSQLEEEQRELRQRLSGDTFEGMIGTSTKMQDIFSAIRKVATTDVPVLIRGESGTGKELVARAIHRLSIRGSRPFIPINCSAIPENLIESELFGHEKGTFTGAHVQRKGRFEMAEGGTLFLDEIGDLPLTLQVKLLRFLQEKTIERVGGREQIEVDTRIVAATNRDLEDAMRKATFRDDLFYRIKKIKGFSSQVIEALERYPWPGNVRELENRIKRSVIMSEGKKITLEDLEMQSVAGVKEHILLKDARETLEKDLIMKAIVRNENNLTKAASDLGISRPTLYDLMQKLGIPK